jgi:hypothetical protein
MVRLKKSLFLIIWLVIPSWCLAQKPALDSKSHDDNLKSCVACHLPRQTEVSNIFRDFKTFVTERFDQKSCVLCHLNNWFAAKDVLKAPWLPFSESTRQRIQTSHPYVNNSPLMFLSTESRSGMRNSVPVRYTDCGLDLFLKQPFERRLNAKTRMFPLPDHMRQEVLRQIKNQLEPCRPSPSVALVSQGKKLFYRLGCSECHGKRFEAPLLRHGIPFLARWFFAERITKGSTVPTLMSQQLWPQWMSKGEKLIREKSQQTLVMPAYPQLTQTDLEALYAYVSTDISDIFRELPTSRKPLEWSHSHELFRIVQDQVFSKSCRHCHSQNPNSQSIIAATFGLETGRTPLIQFPTSGVPIVPSHVLSRVLSPGTNCSDSILLKRLKLRHSEWRGESKTGSIRGMPLTLSPLPTEVITATEIWTKMGCPSDQGLLCRACP